MPKRTCPVCGTVFDYQSVAAHKTFPFCSERCRLIDLGAWFADERQIVEEMRPSEVDEALHEMIDGVGLDASATESAYDYTEPYHDESDEIDDYDHDEPGER